MLVFFVGEDREKASEVEEWMHKPQVWLWVVFYLKIRL